MSFGRRQRRAAAGGRTKCEAGRREDARKHRLQLSVVQLCVLGTVRTTHDTHDTHDTLNAHAGERKLVMKWRWLGGEQEGVHDVGGGRGRVGVFLDLHAPRQHEQHLLPLQHPPCACACAVDACAAERVRLMSETHRTTRARPVRRKERKKNKECVRGHQAVSAVPNTHNTSHPRLTRNVGGFGGCQKNNKTLIKE
jgi:hypothetical protein